jgi:hypothetical protein
MITQINNKYYVLIVYKETGLRTKLKCYQIIT